MKKLTGRIDYRKSTDEDSAVEPGFDTLTVAVIFSATIMDERRLIERRFPVNSDGTYQLNVSDNVQEDDDTRVAVLASSGEVLTSEKLSELVDGDQLAAFSMPSPRVDFKPSELQLAAARSVRITGRLMVHSGEVSSVAVVGISLQADNETGESIQIWSGTTDGNGYFHATFDNRSYKRLVAVIGAADDQQFVDIHLGVDGRVPNPLIIVLASMVAEKGVCARDVVPAGKPEGEELATQSESFSQDLGTSCQSMTTPNRTLEEFDFFQIVRTTDPSIKGATIPGRRGAKFRRGEMERIVFDVGTLAQATGASKLAAKDVLNVATATPTFEGDAARLSSADRAMIELNAATRGLATRANVQPFDQILKDQISVDALSSSGVGSAAVWSAASVEDSALAALNAAMDKIPSAALGAALNDPDGFTPDKVMTLERRAEADALRAYLGGRARKVPGRGPLNEDNAVDWDHTPEFYQATSVAHGHILQFKQEWKADGYSLGDLLQSIPLAPGQRKQIVTLDWDREDRTSRSEVTTATEALEADLSRDRDINEIANASFRENLNGSSSATTGAVGGGFGLAIGPLVIGGGGGSSWASSNANQNASRGFSAQSMNRLSDQTSQATSAVRDQRSTIVRSVEQSERVGAITEVISNFNRCHALTIQYFEVLRHFAVQERLVRASECLFVPLEMTLFDDAKVLRWHEILERACGDRSLRRGFDAIERLSSPATMPPDIRFADDPIEEMSGRLKLRVSIARPKDPDDASKAVLEQTQWGFLGIILRVSPETIYDQYSRNSAKKDQIFRTEIAPKIAREFLKSLEVVLIDRDGQEHPAEFDVTVTSRYQENGIMEVVLNDNAVADRLPRGEIAGIEVRTDYELPEFSKVLLEDARIVYRTKRMHHRLVSRRRINDDILKGDAAYVSSSDLSWIEERNQLAEDRKRRRRLLRHLNDHIEFYHRAIWLSMDSNRRYMLLDGFEAPSAKGRSIASVVENRLIGIVGNCMVMPVAPGFQLDPVLRDVLADTDDASDVLTEIYRVPPPPPRRHSVPTRGVFGEAMPGSCKSCEVIEEDRFWRWSDYPLPDSPPAIAPLSTDSRFAGQSPLTPAPFPDPLIKFQDIPNAPDPTGMSAALNILAQDVFKDLTGLTQNQKNAMAALTSSMASAESFAGEAFSLAMARDSAASLDRTLGQIDSAKAAGYLDDQQASAAARDALIHSFGGSNSPTTKPATQSGEVANAITQAASTPGGSAIITRDNGEDSETVAFESSGSDLVVGAAPLLEWIEHDLWVDLPLVFDEVVPALPSGFKLQLVEHDQIDLARNAAANSAGIDAAGNFITFDAFGWPQNLDTVVLFDFVQSALGSGLMRVNPADASKFQLKIETRLGYPAKSASKATPKAVHFPHSGKRKLPLAVIVHGNSAAWIPTGAKTDITLPDGRAATKGSLTSIPNHEGYRYLQDHMSVQAEPVISLSVNTNIANATGSLVEMRARIINAAIETLKDEIAADPNHFLIDAIDFDNVGLFGHSRGGEAVVRAHQLNLANLKYTTKAICSLAPTDRVGVTNTDKVSVDDPFMSYLLIWGGLDGDVSGKRIPGVLTAFGSGLRIYDRSQSHKALVFAPACTHNRFNNPVWKDETEWQKVVGGGPALDLPAGVVSEAAHEALLKEYVWSFFDLTLNGNAAEQPRFRGEIATTSGLKLIQQWKFGSRVLVVDEFENANADFGTRTLGPGMTVENFTPLKPPPASPSGSRNLHCGHHTQACILDIAAAGPAGSVLHYDLRVSATSGADLTGYDYLTVRLGQLYDPSSQATIDALPPPEFLVRMTDGSGTVVSEDAANVYAAMKNPLATPVFKKIGKGRTQMVLHTFAINPTHLFGTTGDQSVLADMSDITDLEFGFNTGAGAGEVWIDSIRFVKK